MKLAIKSLIILAISASFLFFSGCTKNNPAPPSIQQQQATLLEKGTWKVTSAIKDNVDQTTDYGSFVMTISKITGTTDSVHFAITGRKTGTKSPWGPTGYFTFDATNPATTLTRSNAEVVTYAVSATNMTMNFNYSGAGWTTRQTVVTGAWQFTFVHP